MKRKILSLILVFAMTVSLFTVGASAAEPTYGDTNGHWAESSIERWSAYGIIQGSNGKFDPNGQLTCAQLATILARLLKLPAAKDAGFIDNPADAWYYDAINRCAAAGILKGNGDGTVTPEAPITRERAMVMLARALGIEPLRNPDLTRYTDAAQVSAYAQGYVAALIEAGIVGGVTADELAPQDNINRASTVTILDRAISTYADKAGATVKADGKGIVLVVAENVKITGAPEGTKIVVADGATGLTVNGKSVSDDQTYIVPKTTTGSGSSGGYSHTHSYDPTTHKCSCGEVDPAYAVASVSGKNYLTLSEAITAAQSGNKPVTLAASKTTTETIQEILDGQHGSIDGLTIELPTGNYGQLELGRATKYEGSNTVWYNGQWSAESGWTRVTPAVSAVSGLNNSIHFYERAISDVTLKAADGATVNVAGVKMTSGHMYGSSEAPNYDYVLDRKVFSTNDSYYLAQTVSNIAFVGLNFTAKSDITTSNEETVINGFTFKNCTFNINNTAKDNQAIRYYNENDNGKVSNLVVDNCKFNKCYQGVYTSHIKNVIVTNSEFDTTGHNAIAIQDSNACDHGKVIITGNTFKNIGDRIIRFNNVGADTQITITHNTVIGKLIKKEVIKAESLAAGVTCNIHSNSWGDGATFGDGFTEETGEPCAEINGVKYISLAKALAAAKNGDTVKLLKDITLNETWTPIGTEGAPFKGTFDGQGHTITGLNISSGSYAGLIGVLDAGTVKNVKFASVNISTTGTDVGAAVGRIINNGKVENVQVLSGSVRGAKRVGGVVGCIKAYGSVADCSNAATVSATTYNVGGIVGAAYYTKTGKAMHISNCKNTGVVTSAGVGAGGIVGLSAAHVTGCENSAAVTGTGSIGGIVGEQKSYGSVTNCTNSAAVTNNSTNPTTSYGTGGIIGWLRYHGTGEASAYEVSAIISVTGNSNSGSVSGGNDAGGIIGACYNSAVVTENANTAGSLTATTFAAGIVGNYQTTETPAAAEPASNKLTFKDNTSTTAEDAITASCTDLLIYTNGNVVNGEIRYTLAQFNALTSIPAAAEKVYVDLGNASLQNGLTIGNDNIADHYHYGEWNSDAAPSGYPLKTNIDNFTTHDGEKIRYIYSTGKSAVNIILTGSVTGATDTGDFNAGAITLKVPDAANVIFDTVTFGEGQMAMSMWTESPVQSMTVPHRLASVTFNGCTFKGNWLQNGAFGADEMTITGCTFEKYENTAAPHSDGFDCKNNSNPIWIQNMGQTNVTIEGCTINAVRPIKLWEGTASGTVTIQKNTFNMEKCSIDNDSTHKNIAIMFCGTTEKVKLGNVEISGNTVTGDATSLICFYNGKNAGENHYPAMNEGATFSLYNNILPAGTALSVIWKTATVWAPTYVPIPQ